MGRRPRIATEVRYEFGGAGIIPRRSDFDHNPSIKFQMMSRKMCSLPAFALDLQQLGGEGLELRVPVLGIAVDPGGGLGDGAGLETAAANASRARLRHQASPQPAPAHGVRRPAKK